MQKYCFFIRKQRIINTSEKNVMESRVSLSRLRNSQSSTLVVLENHSFTNFCIALLPSTKVAFSR